jgi:hypothetical protein
MHAIAFVHGSSGNHCCTRQLYITPVTVTALYHLRCVAATTNIDYVCVAVALCVYMCSASLLYSTAAIALLLHCSATMLRISANCQHLYYHCCSCVSLYAHACLHSVIQLACTTCTDC